MFSKCLSGEQYYARACSASVCLVSSVVHVHVQFPFVAALKGALAAAPGQTAGVLGVHVGNQRKCSVGNTCRIHRTETVSPRCGSSRAFWRKRTERRPHRRCCTGRVSRPCEFAGVASGFPPGQTRRRTLDRAARCPRAPDPRGVCGLPLSRSSWCISSTLSDVHPCACVNGPWDDRICWKWQGTPYTQKVSLQCACTCELSGELFWRNENRRQYTDTVWFWRCPSGGRFGGTSADWKFWSVDRTANKQTLYVYGRQTRAYLNELWFSTWHCTGCKRTVCCPDLGLLPARWCSVLLSPLWACSGSHRARGHGQCARLHDLSLPSWRSPPHVAVNPMCLTGLHTRQYEAKPDCDYSENRVEPFSSRRCPCWMFRYLSACLQYPALQSPRHNCACCARGDFPPMAWSRRTHACRWLRFPVCLVCD